MRILIFGDSIAQGFWGIDGGWVEILRKYYDSSAIKDLRNHKQPAIFNLGISGDTTRNLLDRIENETKVRKWPGDPVIVVVAIGTNDDLFKGDGRPISSEEFKTNLQKIVSLLKPISDGIIFVGNPACEEEKTTPVFWSNISYTNAELENSEKAIEEVAKEHQIPYVPLFRRFKDELDSGSELLADGLHPNDQGHQLIADLVLPVLNKTIAGSIS